MKKILIYFILIFVFNTGNSFQAQAGTAGILQYCLLESRWSAMIKKEQNFYNDAYTFHVQSLGKTNQLKTM